MRCDSTHLPASEPVSDVIGEVAALGRRPHEPGVGLFRNGAVLTDRAVDEFHLQGAAGGFIAHRPEVGR